MNLYPFEPHVAPRGNTRTRSESRPVRRRLPFYRACVDWPMSDVATPGGLSEMIDQAVDITRGTFRRRVNRDQLDKLEDAMGYARRPGDGLTMAGDCHVSYHRSRLHGQTVYYFRHSAIEYVFAGISA